MRSTPVTVLITAVVAAALVPAACGGDDDGSEEDADITEAITQAATLDTVEACTEFQSLAFTEQTEFTTGEQAIARCEESAGDGGTAGESVDVENIEVAGDRATADVTFSGGAFDAQQLAVSLVKEEDQWKLDSLDEFVAFDRTAFAEALATSASEDERVTEEIAACVKRTVEATPEEQIQTAVLSGNEGEFAGIYGDCFG